MNSVIPFVNKTTNIDFSLFLARKQDLGAFWRKTDCIIMTGPRHLESRCGDGYTLGCDSSEMRRCVVDNVHFGVTKNSKRIYATKFSTFLDAYKSIAS
jgi:hypothetical protein